MTGTIVSDIVGARFDFDMRVKLIIERIHDAS